MISVVKLLKNGGASRDRTDGLVVANDALSQLSYSPISGTERTILSGLRTSMHSVRVSVS